MRTDYSITGKTLSKYPDIIKVAAQIKAAQAKTHADFGFVSRKDADLITKACNDVVRQPPQELLALEMWSSDLRPLHARLAEHLSQTAGVSMTVVNLLKSDAAFAQTTESLVTLRRLVRMTADTEVLIEAFRIKAAEFREAVRLTRANLNEDVPGTWGQVFAAQVISMEEAFSRIKRDVAPFRTVLV